MALAISLLDNSVASATDATSYTTALVTPTGGAEVAVAVFNSKASATDTPTLDSPTWLSGTWTQLQTIEQGGNRRLTVFHGRAIGSPSADNITASFGGATQTGCRIIVFQATGQDTTTPVPQSNQGSGTGTSATTSLPGALAGTDSVVVGIFGINSNAAITPGDGETEIADGGHNAPTRALQAQYKLNDATSNATFANSGFVWVSFEFKAAGGVSDADAEVSWAEVEVPTANAAAEVSWSEVEVPFANANAEVSWSEVEIPFAQAAAEIAHAEVEIPFVDASAEISWAEVEVPLISAQAELSWAEFEIPFAQAQAELGWAEFEVEFAPASAEVSWAEVEVPDLGAVFDESMGRRSRRFRRRPLGG